MYSYYIYPLTSIWLWPRATSSALCRYVVQMFPPNFLSQFPGDENRFATPQ